MQFIRNGPEIPDRLLHDHEDGRVVFFCGAGISFPAKLPGFKELVDDLFSKIGGLPSELEEAAIKSKQFDTAIGLLESRVGDRIVVRRNLHEILRPDLSIKRALTTHESLLTLSRNRNDQIRLITTNFDHLFELAKKELNIECKVDRAPTLDVPKNRWSGLVYLHGLLPHPDNDEALNRLVLSSGDFGLAYLTERWAARFVTELFRNFTVCFVGYSIGDAVLRYMLDALAADRLLGEGQNDVFSFAQFSAGEKEKTQAEWEAKNVTPILYKKHWHHFYLHRTLERWAKDFRDGVQSKERTVIDYGNSEPQRSTEQDDFVGRVLWSLCDMSGLPARRFAELTPPPNLQWLEPLADKRFSESDLNRFGVGKIGVGDKALSFSLIRRPSSYNHAPWMALVDSRQNMTVRWDKIMTQLARWLARHLNKPDLIVWFANNGGSLHQFLVEDLNSRIDDELRNNSLSPSMHTLWRMLLSKRAVGEGWYSEIYEWQRRFRTIGLTPLTWLELRDYLSPKVRFSAQAPRPLPSDGAEEIDDNRPSDLVDCKLVLGIPHAHHSIADLKKDEQWQQVVADHLSEFTGLLLDTVSLMEELGAVDNISDRSYLYQPSISAHSQNRKFYDWTLLIDLARDAWLAEAERSPGTAKIEAERWIKIEYPLFRRLAFFAAANLNDIAADQGLEWLLIDEGWWLWSIETEREGIRLLAHIAPLLRGNQKRSLETAILLGPPRNMFRDDLEEDDFRQRVIRDVWFRLAKCDSAGTILGEEAQIRFDQISNENPQWELAEDERDEFPVWLGEGIDWRETATTPIGAHELVEWLRANPVKDEWKEDDWRDRCKSDFRRSAAALKHLANRDEWITGRWNTAIQAWSNDELAERAWLSVSDTLARAPIAVLTDLDYSVSWWIRSIAKDLKGENNNFFFFANALLDIHEVDVIEPEEDPVHSAINHPVGHATEAVIRYWYRQSLQDGQQLEEPFRTFFSRISNQRVPSYRYGRHLLCRNVVSIFRVDPDWVKENLLQAFSWGDSPHEALLAWSGYFSSPRLYEPFIEAVKSDFLLSAQHYEELGVYGDQFARVFASAALKRLAIFKASEYAEAFQNLPSDGLGTVADTIEGALEGAGEKRAEYWANRGAPLFKQLWPKSIELITSRVSEKLAKVCIASGTEFPNSLKVLENFIIPVDHPDYVVRLLHDKEHCLAFPAPSLDLLDRVIGENAGYPPSNLRDCLNSIITQDELLTRERKYIRLDNYLRGHGQ